MTVMQKAVTPQVSAAYLESGYDRVAGFVVRADSVEWATTPADLFEAHGLAFPGSPFSPEFTYGADKIAIPEGAEPWSTRSDGTQELAATYSNDAWTFSSAGAGS